MKTAINQPYYYPYLGYFKLIKKVDNFVFLTDSQYVRRSWINRNRIKSCDKEWQYIIVPTKKHKQIDKINEIVISGNDWHDTQVKTFLCVYGKKIQSHYVFQKFMEKKYETNLSNLLCSCIKDVCDFLKIKTNFLDSKVFCQDLKGEERIVQICKETKTKIYYNLPNGISLYDKKKFIENDIEILFNENVDGNCLSILDLLFGDGLASI